MAVGGLGGRREDDGCRLRVEGRSGEREGGGWRRQLTSFGQTKVNSQRGGSPHRTSIKHFKDHRASVHGHSSPTPMARCLLSADRDANLVLYTNKRPEIRKHTRYRTTLQNKAEHGLTACILL